MEAKVTVWKFKPCVSVDGQCFLAERRMEHFLEVAHRFDTTPAFKHLQSQTNMSYIPYLECVEI